MSAVIETQAEADARRLDWLEAMGNLRGGLLLHNEDNTGRVGLGLANTGRTLRVAIDDAMDIERGEP